MCEGSNPFDSTVCPYNLMEESQPSKLYVVGVRVLLRVLGKEIGVSKSVPVVWLDKDTMEISEFDTMILWNFDSFMARLIVKAMDDALEHTKYSFYAAFHEDDEPQHMEDEANRWLNQVMFVRDAFENYTTYPEDIESYIELEAEQTRRVQEALPILGEIYSGLWN